MANLICLMAYVGLLHLGPALNIARLLPPGRVFLFTTAAHVIGAVFTLNYLGRASRARQRAMSTLDVLVTAHLVWSIASILLYFQEDSPTAIDGYWYGIHHFTLPILGYFIVKQLRPGEVMRVLRFIVYANAFAMLLGIYLFYTRPDFYTSFLRESYFSQVDSMDLWQLYARMQSYFGSTAVGILSALSIVLIRLTNPPVVLAFTGVGLFCTAALLSQQRGGMIACLIAVTYFILFHKSNRVLGAAILTIGLVVSLAILDTFDDEHEGVFERIANRTTEVSDAFEGRSGYSTVWNYVIDFPWGVGIGATGAAASSYQERGKIVDANFMRIMADLGIQGLTVFLVMMGVAVLASLKRPDHLGWVTIMTIYVVVALGTNTLDSHYVSHLFWILLAAMDTPQQSTARLPITVETQPPGAEATPC